MGAFGTVAGALFAQVVEHKRDDPIVGSALRCDASKCLAFARQSNCRHAAVKRIRNAPSACKCAIAQTVRGKLLKTSTAPLI